jgi:AcrR family transcriptional regulator
VSAANTASEAIPGLARREAILEAATALFAESGYHAVGMRAIADAVGVRSSSLYHHFPSKQALLAAIASEATHEFVTSYVTVLESDAPAAERVAEVLRAQVVFYWQHRLSRQVGLTNLRELKEDDRELYDSIHDDLRSYQHAITKAIEDGLQAGVFTAKGDPKLLSTAVVAMVLGVNDWFREGGELTIEQVADRYAAIVVEDLLGARPPRRGSKRAAR